MAVDPAIFDGVSGIVLGLRPTDTDPEWTLDEQDSESQRNLESVFGSNVSLQESTDAKN